jgi:Tfp pilus assembly protein PilO
MNPRERLMLMVAIVLLGGVVWKFMVHDPQAAQYAQLVQARDAAKAELDKDRQILAREQQVRQEYARLSALVRLMEAKLPSEKEIPALLTAMEQFTRRIDVGLDSIHPTQLQVVTASGQPASGASKTVTTKNLPYSRMEVGLGLSGTFGQAMTYLRQLHDLPRLVVVDSVTMSPKKLPLLTMTINTEIYVVGTPAGARK